MEGDGINSQKQSISESIRIENNKLNREQEKLKEAAQIENDRIKRKNTKRRRIETSLMIIGSIYALLVMVLSALLFYIFQTPFTIFSRWFSNMGVGLTGWSFNQGLQGTAIFYTIMVFIISFRMVKAKKATKILIAIGNCFGIIAITGIFILTINTMQSNQPLHDIGAYMYFVATPFYCSFITAAFWVEGKLSKIHVFTTILLVVSSISMIPLMAVIADNLGISSGDALGSMDPSFGIARAFEWLAVLLFFIWIFETGFLYRSFLKNQEKIIEKTESIGIAEIKEDGTIVLKLRAEGPIGIRGDAMFEYTPNHPEYKNILEHIEGIRPGEEKPIPPFD